MLTQKTIEETAELCPERRNKARLRQDATISIRHPRRELRSITLIESTRHGARLVVAGKVKKEDGLDFQVKIGRNTFAGKARVAWTMPLSSGQQIAGLEFLTFHLAA